MAISYIGGKARISKFIIPFIPKDIETYVEPFSGMFWVFLNMDLERYPNLKTVVYNDYNKLNANLFRCIKEDKNELIRLLKEFDGKDGEYGDEINKIQHRNDSLIPAPDRCRVFFDQCQKEVFDPNFEVGEIANFDAAVKYVVVLTQVFSGSKPEKSTFTNYMGKYRSKIFIFIDKLQNAKFIEHFNKINCVENMDFEDVVKKYDAKSTYFYLDPPYWKTENYYSNHDFDVNDHKRLSNTLQTIKGRFSLSYYHFTQLDEWFPKGPYVWAQKNFKKAAAAKKDGTQNEGTELLIMNYDVPDYL
jgi:DNA adenine methylase